MKRLALCRAIFRAAKSGTLILDPRVIGIDWRGPISLGIIRQEWVNLRKGFVYHTSTVVWGSASSREIAVAYCTAEIVGEQASSTSRARPGRKRR